MNNQLFAEKLILPTSEWGVDHTTAMNVVTVPARLAEVLPEQKGFDRDGRTYAKLVKLFGNIDRDLLRMSHGQIARTLKYKGVSEITAFVNALARVIQVPWMPIQVDWQRETRGKMADYQNNVTDGSQEAKESQHGGNSDDSLDSQHSDWSNDSHNSQHSDYSIVAPEIVDTRESQEPLTVDMVSQFLQIVLLAYHEDSADETWELSIS
jgi:hypothetical protein